MIALIFIRLLFLLGVGIILWRQIVGPLMRGDRMFPWFRDKPQHIKEAEERLLDAKSAKEAATINKEALTLDREAQAITDELFTKKENNTQ